MKNTNQEHRTRPKEKQRQEISKTAYNLLMYLLLLVEHGENRPPEENLLKPYFLPLKRKKAEEESLNRFFISCQKGNF